MNHANRYFTFMYVPAENDGLKTVRIRRWLVFSLFGTIALLMVTSAVVLLKYSSNLTDTYRVSRLERENRLLRGQLTDFQQQVGALEHHVQQNFDFQKKARILANLEDMSEDIAEVGVGGPNYGYVRSLSMLDDKTRGTVSGLKADIDKLVRQAKLQRESYGQIISHLSDRHKRLNATPSIRPVPRGYLSSRFGRRMDPITGRASNHYGVDYSARLGTPILVTGDGVVTFAGKWASFGLTVEISHGFGLVTRYAHTSKILVKKGQRVKRGDVIARVGSSGKSTATHLHYEVLKDGRKRNPLAYVLSGKEVTD